MPSCVWVRVPSLALYQEIEECSFGLFFYAREQSSDKRSGPRGFIPLCHCVTSPAGERKRLSPFRSLARFLEIKECSPVSFFAPASEVRENRSGPRGFVPLCHCVTSPWGERKRLSPFRSLARFLEIEDCSPVSFFAPAGGVLESAPSKSYESADGGAAVGGMAAHGLVNGMSGASPTGMSEANLPRPHLRRARYRPRKNAKHKRQSGRFPCRDDATPSII